MLQRTHYTNDGEFSQPKNLFEDMLIEPKCNVYREIYQDKPRLARALNSKGFVDFKQNHKASLLTSLRQVRHVA